MSALLIRHLFEAVDARDWDDLRRVFHPSVRYERPGYAPLVGVDRVLDFYRHERVIASGVHDIEQIVVESDYGACWGRFVGARKDTSPVDERFADAYAFSDDKIRMRRSFFFRPAV